MAPIEAVPNLMMGPGFLFWAPLGTALPANTATGSVFTDTWPVAWIPLGATADGTSFNYAITSNPIEVAEFLDPIKYAVTAREGSFSFSLTNYTLTNVQRMMNGGAITTTGTAGTTVSTWTPPIVGSEVRCMIGWEAADSTERRIAYQCLNTASIQTDYKKSPNISAIPAQFMFEIPSSGQPFIIATAGVTRLGS